MRPNPRTTTTTSTCPCTAGLRRQGGQGYFDPPQHLLTSFYKVSILKFGGHLSSSPSLRPQVRGIEPFFFPHRLHAAIFVGVVGHPVGHNLQELLNRETRLGELAAVAAALDVLQGLKAMHSERLYHLRIRPSSIIQTQVRKTLAFYGCVPAGMHGPTRILWASLTAFALLAAVGRELPQAAGGRCRAVRESRERPGRLGPLGLPSGGVPVARVRGGKARPGQQQGARTGRADGSVGRCGNALRATDGPASLWCER